MRVEEKESAAVTFPLIPVGLGAVVVCCLKGRWRQGSLAIAILVVVSALVGLRGDATAADVSLWTRAMMEGGFLAFVIAAVFFASQPALSGTWWDRRSAVDLAGTRLIEKEPILRRVRRAAVGFVLGTVPGFLFTLGVVVVDLIVGLSGDNAQIGFLGVGLAIYGAVAGTVVGFGWVSRSALKEDLKTNESVG